jgi:putative redox protein
MHLVYEFVGENLDLKKLQKAVELSQDKYCGVSAMYRGIMEITREIRIC